MLPEISIIIPTYNRAHFIGETIDSVLSQTYKNWECLIIDDDSEDYTGELLGFYCEKDLRIRYFKRPRYMQKGASACRNYGFEKSKGEYINWFDSDDIMFPEFLSVKLEALQKENTICCISDFNILDTKKNLEKKIEISSINLNNIYQALVTGKMAIPTNNPLWSKKFLLDKPLFNENLHQSQDLEFHSRIFRCYNNISVVEQPLFNFRMGHNSISKKFKKSKEGIDSYLLVKKGILDKNSQNSEIKDFIMLDVMSTFRYLLTIKNYSGCEAILKFIKENYQNFAVGSKASFLRLLFFYKLIKLIGFGETRLKSFLSLQKK